MQIEAISSEELQTVLHTTIQLVLFLWGSPSPGQEHDSEAKAREEPQDKLKRLLANKRFRKIVTKLMSAIIKTVCSAVIAYYFQS